MALKVFGDYDYKNDNSHEVILDVILHSSRILWALGKLRWRVSAYGFIPEFNVSTNLYSVLFVPQVFSSSDK